MLDRTIVIGAHQDAAILEYVVNRFDDAMLPVFMTNAQWKNWLIKQIIIFPPFLVINDIDSLSSSQREEVFEIIADYCEESLLVMSKIMRLNMPVNGFEVITSPSVL